MLFNSLDYAVFLPVVFILYWFVCKDLRSRNILLLFASYFFYSCWDWRFTFLLLFSTLLDFYSGLAIDAADTIGKKRFWLWLSISINLGFLAVFKYYNFFIDNIKDIAPGVHFNTLEIILPVGISFYTFHGLSYVLDIYFNRIKPERNFINYGLFVSFFPLLVAGPIERATHLLPQVKSERSLSYSQAASGLRQILWGLFKKLVIADNCAAYVDTIFNNSNSLSGSTLALGAFFFSFQIYCDFSGYSDIALGTANLFGIKLLRNFAFPYFSRDIAEFWRRWHISLSSWFRDYVYVPLGGSRVSKWKQIRNTFIIFLLSGFWHGANWTFIIWGLLNAICFMPLLIIGRNRRHIGIIAQDSVLPSAKETIALVLTFSLTTFNWIFFRATSPGQAWDYVAGIFNSSIFSIPNFPGIKDSISIILIIFGFIVVEWAGRKDEFAIQHIFQRTSYPFRWVIYATIVFVIGMYAQTNETPFIYFQF
ncbi:MAG: MBOAT family O-acyltransferase [Chryseolinea sp.]